MLIIPAKKSGQVGQTPKVVGWDWVVSVGAAGPKTKPRGLKSAWKTKKKVTKLDD